MIESLNIRAVFGHAIELANAVERRAYLDEVCANAPELRRRVDGLLQAYDDAGSFLQTPAAQIGAEALAARREELPQTVALSEQSGTIVVGRYKLLQQIGEG